VINEAPASDLQLWFTSTSNVCADNLAGVEHQGGTAFVLDLGFGPGVPIAAGNVYESGLDAGVPSSGNSIGLYSFSGPNCQYTAGGPNVDTASITVDTITQTRLQGSFQVQAGPDTLQGTFDLPICPSNASMMAGNATTCCP
jgi:hypothetical protein